MGSVEIINTIKELGQRMDKAGLLAPFEISISGVATHSPTPYSLKLELTLPRLFIDINILIRPTVLKNQNYQKTHFIVQNLFLIDMEV
jgi:hypothetical protein